MAEIVGVQPGANGGDHAVHHAAGGDDVGPGGGVGHGRGRQHVQRFIVQHKPFRQMGMRAIVEQAAVAVVGVFAQAHVGDDDEVGHGRFNRPNRLLHNAVVGKVFQADGVFEGRDAEEDDGGDVQGNGRFRFAHRLGYRQLGDARHGGNGRTAVAVPHKQRVNQIIRREMGFAHHAPQAGRRAQPARASGQVYKGSVFVFLDHGQFWRREAGDWRL